MCAYSDLSAVAGNETITAIPDVRVGHYEDREALRGVTVIRFSRAGAVASVDVRGSAPGTRETDLLDPINMIERIHAVILAGGSAYGLESASGVMACLEEEGIGYPARKNIIIPIVPAAVIFDLYVGNSLVRPTRAWGYRACKSASGAPVGSGNVGAGLGATVGKIPGSIDRAMKGGLGSFVVDLPGGVKVGALMVVNAVGDVVDPSIGRIVAGARGERRGAFVDAVQVLLDGGKAPPIFQGTNTTIGVVATNAGLNKVRLNKVAQMAHNGLARAIRPAHTAFDGDTIFAVSVPGPGEGLEAEPMAVAVAAERAVERAILLAVEGAETVAGIPAIRDWK